MHTRLRVGAKAQEVIRRVIDTDKVPDKPLDATGKPDGVLSLFP